LVHVIVALFDLMLYALFAALRKDLGCSLGSMRGGIFEFHHVSSIHLFAIDDGRNTLVMTMT